MTQKKQIRTENAWFSPSKPGNTRTVFNDLWHGNEVIVAMDRKKNVGAKKE